MQTIKKRKGFTLTELAIVIAVIAILIAVLVPTFVSLINKAQETNDSMLVKNLNTSMSTYASLNGKEEDEIDVIEALTALEDDGYTLSKLTPTSTGANIVYNQSTHTFILFKDNYAEDSDISTTGDYVVIGCSTSGVQTAYESTYGITKFCVYATDGTDIECTYNTNNGTEVTIYLYSENGTVNINTPYATVEHFGSAEIVNINAVAYASYHLHGEVGELTLAKGHAELKSTAVVDTVEIAPADGETPVLTVVTGAKVEEYKVEENSNYKVETKTSDDAETTTATTITAIASASGAILNQNITLTADRTDGLTVAEKTVIVLDLNGYTLSSTSGLLSSSYRYTIYVYSGASLTIKDSSAGQTGKVEVSASSYSTIAVYNKGELTIESGTISGTSSRNSNSISSYYYSYGIYNVGELNMDGGTIIACATNSAGGTNKPTVYGIRNVDTSSTATITGGTITAYATNDTSGTTTSATVYGIYSLSSNEMKVSDCTINSRIGAEDGTSGITWGSGASAYGISGDTGIITVENCTINVTATANGSSVSTITYGVKSNGETTLKGSRITTKSVSTGVTNTSNSHTLYSYGVYNLSQSEMLTISGCTVSTECQFDSSDAKATISTNCYVYTWGMCKIDSGTFTATNSSSTASVTYYGLCVNTYSDANMKITGGTFNVDPSQYVASSYKVTNNTDGTYTVG